MPATKFQTYKYEDKSVITAIHLEFAFPEGPFINDDKMIFLGLLKQAVADLEKEVAEFINAPKPEEK